MLALEQTMSSRHIDGMAIQIRTSLDEPTGAQVFVPHRPARPEKSEGGK